MKNTKKEINYCTCKKCGHRHRIDLREICLYAGLVRNLGQIYKWCVEKEKFEFKRGDVAHLINTIEYARFADWEHFGRLIRSKGEGIWEINIIKCEKFFFQDKVIPYRLTHDPITKEWKVVEYRIMKQIPELYKFLTENGMYKAKYENRDSFSNIPDEGDEEESIKDL
jgi:hypothetical protein